MTKTSPAHDQETTALLVIDVPKIFEFLLAILGGILAVSSMSRIMNNRN